MAKSLKRGTGKQSKQSRRSHVLSALEPLERRTLLTVTASFVPASGLLTVLGDNMNNNIVVSRNAAGTILINGGGVPIAGGQATVANTQLIQVFGQDGNDNISLDEANGALPAANLFGGNNDDTLTGGSGNDLLFGQAIRCWERGAMISFSAGMAMIR